LGTKVYSLYRVLLLNCLWNEIIQGNIQHSLYIDYYPVFPPLLDWKGFRANDWSCW